MTEKQYKKLLIDTIQIEDNEDKDKIIELLKFRRFLFRKNMSLHIIFRITEKST